jgi:hypothetical protein
MNCARLSLMSVPKFSSEVGLFFFSLGGQSIFVRVACIPMPAWSSVCLHSIYDL